MVREGKEVNEKEERGGQMGEGNGERLRERTKREEKGVRSYGKGKRREGKEEDEMGNGGKAGKRNALINLKTLPHRQCQRD